MCIRDRRKSLRAWTQNNGHESGVGGTYIRHKPDGSRHGREFDRGKGEKQARQLKLANDDTIPDHLFLKGWVSEQWPPSMYFHFVVEVRIVPGWCIRAPGDVMWPSQHSPLISIRMTRQQWWQRVILKWVPRRKWIPREFNMSPTGNRAICWCQKDLYQHDVIKFTQLLKK
mgnify:CR=1 FL=1